MIKPVTKGKALQKKTGAEHSGHNGHQADGSGGEAELHGLEVGGSTLGGAGSRRATASGSGDIARALGSSTGGLDARVLGTLARETFTLTGTLGQVLLGGGGHGGESIGGDIPVGLLHLGAAGGTTSGVVVAIATRVVGLLESSLESLIVLVGGDLVTGDLGQAVLVGLLAVLVDQTTGVNAGHLFGVQGANLVELTGVGVAAVLGEEEGKSVASEVLHLLVPAGSGEGRGITPGVVVKGEEVTTLVVGTAVHVLGHLETVGVNIGGGVTDGHLTELTGAEESAHITGDGLNVRSGLRGGAVVDNLVTGEEGKGVIVLSELLHGCEDVLEVDIVVGDLGFSTVEGVLGSVDVENEVDTGLGQGVHALVVVLGVIDGVDTDSVQAKLLEVFDVTLTSIDIGDGVGKLGRASGLVINTTHVEALLALEEGVTLDSDGGNIGIIVAGLDVGTEDGGGAESDGRGHGGYGGLHNVVFLGIERRRERTGEWK